MVRKASDRSTAAKVKSSKLDLDCLPVEKIQDPLHLFCSSFAPPLLSVSLAHATYTKC